MKCLVFIVSFILPTTLLASFQDPHRFPKSGTDFFEGWYTRIHDFDNQRTLGFLYGAVNPPVPSRPYPADYVSILFSSQKETNGKLVAKDELAAGYTVLDGEGNPIDHSPSETPVISSYKYCVGKNDSNCLVQGEVCKVSFYLPKAGVTFKAEIFDRTPWDPNRLGDGPAGPIDSVPGLPLHWFVYSTRSPVTYSYFDHQTGTTYEGRGVAHQEKNWGGSFPQEWIWSQGFDEKASFALAGGPQFGLNAFFFGYRNPSKNVSVSSQPITVGLVNIEKDSCAGNIFYTFNSLNMKITLNVTGVPAEEQTCLLGPMNDGFRKVCAETFSAVAVVKIEELGWDLNWNLVEERKIKDVALEFGGKYLCETYNPCNPGKNDPVAGWPDDRQAESID